MKRIIPALLFFAATILQIGCMSDETTGPTSQPSAVRDEGISALNKPGLPTERPTLSFNGDEMTVSWPRVKGATYYKIQWYQYTGDPQAPVMLYMSPFSNPVKGTTYIAKDAAHIMSGYHFLARVDAFNNKNEVLITLFSLYFLYQ